MIMPVERIPALTTAITENLKPLKGGAVGIDIDAVTQATFILALNYVSHDFKKVILKENLRSYWELASIAEANGISADKAVEYAKNAWNRHEVYLNSPIMPGITPLIEIFESAGFPYFFISSRPPEFLETTQKWFAKKFPWVKKQNIILGRKIEAIKEHGIALHIEDAPEEALNIIHKTLARVLLVPQPWNLRERIDNPRIRQLGPYSDTAGVWPVLRFLASPNAKEFLNDVAQY